MKTLSKALKPYLQSKMLAILAWSFACGMPLALVTSSLAAYLIQTNVSLQTIGLFSLAALPYSLKYFFAPLVQTKAIPILQRRFGRVRSWMLAAFVGIILGLIGMGYFASFGANAILPLFVVTAFTVLCSSINDTAEAEYRIELLQDDEFGHGMACYAIGYRLGMIMGGGGALLFATHLSWATTYYLMAAFVMVGILAVIRQAHVTKPVPVQHSATWQAYIFPLKLLVRQPGWIYVLLLVIIYNYADDLLNMMLNPFLMQSGFSIKEIGIWQGSIGGIVGMIGGIISGPLLSRFGLPQMLLACISLLVISNLLFVPLAYYADPQALSPSMHYLFRGQAVLGNFLQGISTIAYISFIAKQCHAPYTATQNAFLTSVMAGSKVLFAATGGYIATSLGWTNFFLHICLVSLPIFVLIWIYKNITKNKASYA